MQLVRNTPIILFSIVTGQVIFLKEYTFQTALVLLVLGATSFLFSYFENRKKISELESQITELKTEIKNVDSRYETKLNELTGSIGSIMVNNNIKSRRM